MNIEPSIAVAFLARGLHPEWQHAFRRFVVSYQRFAARQPHRLYVIFKGFRDEAHLREGAEFFAELEYAPIHTVDAGFDIGCYQRVAAQLDEELVCFLNTKSEILTANWLQKLSRALSGPGVGLVGNTGSYESLYCQLPSVPPFPNPHIRTNAFLMRRDLFLEIAGRFTIATKDDGWMFECGPESLTRQVLARGLQALMVDRDGVGYAAEEWQASNTYRTPTAAPLVGDDAYRRFAAADESERRALAAITWGPLADEARVRSGLPLDERSGALDAPQVLVEESAG